MREQVTDAMQSRQVRGDSDYQQEKSYHWHLSYSWTGTADCQTCQVSGPTISSDLSWNRHIDNTIKRATNSLNFMKRNILDCPPRVKEQCYKSLVRPVAEYAALVLDAHTSSNISKLEMVQRRTTRFVKEDSDRTSSVTSMLNNLGWDTLQERRQMAKTTMFYRIVYGLVAFPHNAISDPSRSQWNKRTQHEIPHLTFISECHSVFLFPQYHENMESSATAGRVSPHFGCLQAAAS